VVGGCFGFSKNSTFRGANSLIPGNAGGCAFISLGVSAISTIQATVRCEYCLLRSWCGGSVDIAAFDRIVLLMK
jgi:hypothetical protein